MMSLTETQGSGTQGFGTAEIEARQLAGRIEAAADRLRALRTGEEFRLLFTGLPYYGPADRFEFELEDPVLKRKISHGYDVITMPVLG